MPMNPGSLVSSLNSMFSQYDKSNAQAANEFADAVGKFWGTAMAPGGGRVSTGPVRSILAQTFRDMYSQNSNNSLQAASVMTSGLTSALGSIVITGGLYGTGPCTPLGSGVLYADLVEIFNRSASRENEPAASLAQAIYNFTRATVCVGTGTESPPIPKIGPLI